MSSGLRFSTTGSVFYGGNEDLTVFQADAKLKTRHQGLHEALRGARSNYRWHLLAESRLLRLCALSGGFSAMAFWFFAFDFQTRKKIGFCARVFKIFFSCF
jgi:hypothetical protein